MGGGTKFCGKACGAKYCGDWTDNPPCDDPCDSCGNYIGGGRQVSYQMPRSAGAIPMETEGGCDCGH
jgi:hypothetical protein